MKTIYLALAALTLSCPAFSSEGQEAAKPVGQIKISKGRYTTCQQAVGAIREVLPSYLAKLDTDLNCKTVLGKWSLTMADRFSGTYYLDLSCVSRPNSEKQILTFHRKCLQNSEAKCVEKDFLALVNSITATEYKEVSRFTSCN